MNKKNFAVIGCGLVGSRWHSHVYHALPQCNLKAVCDLDINSAKKTASMYHVPKYTEDYLDIANDDEIDAVSIATPDHLHKEIALSCINAGKHILVEKPLAKKSQESKQILEAAREKNTILAVDFHNRVNPNFINAKQIIDSGKIGEIQYMNAKLNNSLNVPKTMLKWSNNSSPLWFLGSHTLDLGRWLVNSEIESVYSVSQNKILKTAGINSPDFYLSTINFINGSYMVMENAWILPNSEPVVFNFKFEIVGSDGTIYINSSDHRSVQVFESQNHYLPDIIAGESFNDEVTGPEAKHVSRISGFVYESIARFADAVCYKTEPLANGRDGHAVTHGLESIEKSASTFQPVLL